MRNSKDAVLQVPVCILDLAHEKASDFDEGKRGKVKVKVRGWGYSTELYLQLLQLFSYLPLLHPTLVSFFGGDSDDKLSKHQQNL